MATPISWNSPSTAAASLAGNLDSNGGAWCIAKIDIWNCATSSIGNFPPYRAVRFVPGVNGARDTWLDGNSWPHWHKDLSGAVIGWAFIE
ncbi:hypothetical protein [Burkholderia diffusa]|uniref:hypothetical protein n=1 Tax=Burkholderia diffusa TaxID=488732 RepID=UPI00158C5EFF|nr:hypothetical protein [Burkholderia diffusa]